MARPRVTVKVEPAQKRWLNKQEAMAYLGVSEDYLRDLRNSALISYSQMNRMIWYDLLSLDRFIENHKIV